jgi:hypothetical protein
VNRINEVKEPVIEPNLTPIMKSNVNKSSPGVKSSSTIVKSSPNISTHKTVDKAVIDKTATPLQQHHSSNIISNSKSDKSSPNSNNSNNNSNSIPGIQTSRSSPQINSTSANGVSPTVFEKEALALQQELAQMQKTLKERMEKYQVLTTFSLPN